MGALRLFLAAGVVFGHFLPAIAVLNWPVNDRLTAYIIGGRAVCFFYVVSGFLISYALNHKYPATKDGTRAFYRSRFLRIYPLWWAILFGALPLVDWLSTHRAIELVPGTLLIGIDWITAFWAYPNGFLDYLPSYAGVGWTLAPELAFYILAPWLLRHPKATLVAGLGSLAIRFVATALNTPGTNLYVIWTYFFPPATFVFFMIGHWSERLSVRFPIPALPSLVLLGASLILSCLDLTPTIDGWLPWASCVFFAMALPGVFRGTKDNGFFNYLGDLTYPLYLTHLLTIMLLNRYMIGNETLMQHLGDLSTVIARGPSGNVYFLLFLLVTIAVAATAHAFIELPLRAGFGTIMSKPKPKRLGTIG